MPSYDYHNMGGISGVTDNSQIPYSKRGHDQDRVQNFVFQCDPANPFTGIVHLQISQSEPPQPATRSNLLPTGDDLIWVDVAVLDFVAEDGSIFLQLEVETAQIRAVCKPGNYTSGKILSITTMR